MFLRNANIYQITLRHPILCTYSSEILVHHQHELHAPGVLMMLADVYGQQFVIALHNG